MTAKLCAFRDLSDMSWHAEVEGHKLSHSSAEALSDMRALESHLAISPELLHFMVF